MGILKSLFGKPGKPVQNAIIYIEPEESDIPVAFQKTGKAGGATFAHLDKGMYRIIMALPPQKGKLANESEDLPDDLHVGYHKDKNIYFVREPGGFFTIRFSNLKNLYDDNITPLYETDKNDPARLVVGKFEVDGKYGSVTMKVSALTEKSFEKLIERYAEDVKMVIIRNEAPVITEEEND
jgi:hypothetical protein